MLHPATDVEVLIGAPADEVRRVAAKTLRASGIAGDTPSAGSVAFHTGEPVPVRVRVSDGGAGGSRMSLAADPPPRVPYFGWFVRPMLRSLNRRALRYGVTAVTAAVRGAPPPPAPRRPPLAPPASFSPLQAVLLATVSAITAVTTFGGSLLSQNVNYVAESFATSDQALSVVLALSRAGVLISLVATAMADRRGRRRLLLASFTGVCLANGVAAVAPNLVVFTAGQILMRGFVNTALAVGAVAVIEEAPEGARAYSLALLGLAGGFGYAVGVVLLPLADLGPDVWRGAFALSAVSVLLLPSFARHLAETARYSGLEARGADRGRLGEVFDASYGGRFGVLVAASFLLSIFAAPTSQFTNRYLQDVRGFSGGDITLFRTITQGIPGVVGIVIGGRLAETKGRRPVAASALAAATVAEMTFLLTSGAPLWLSSAAAIVLGGIAAPALSAFSGEMFPTEIRGTANGMLLVAGVAGSVVGLLTAGALSERLGLGPALALMGIPALIAAALLIPRLPESAARPLDEVSPSEV